MSTRPCDDDSVNPEFAAFKEEMAAFKEEMAEMVLDTLDIPEDERQMWRELR